MKPFGSLAPQRKSRYIIASVRASKVNSRVTHENAYALSHGCGPLDACTLGGSASRQCAGCRLFSPWRAMCAKSNPRSIIWAPHFLLTTSAGSTTRSPARTRRPRCARLKTRSTSAPWSSSRSMPKAACRWKPGEAKPELIEAGTRVFLVKVDQSGRRHLATGRREPQQRPRLYPVGQQPGTAARAYAGTGAGALG